MGKRPVTRAAALSYKALSDVVKDTQLFWATRMIHKTRNNTRSQLGVQVVFVKLKKAHRLCTAPVAQERALHRRQRCPVVCCSKLVWRSGFCGQCDSVVFVNGTELLASQHN